MNSKVDPKYPLKVKRLPDGNRELIDPLKVTGLRTRLPRAVDADDGEVTQGTVFVNAGFVTDYSSIPTKLHGFVRWSKVDIAGVVHDFLYRNTNCPRIEADAIWRELARSGGHCAGRFQAWVAWVMLCGFGGWSKPYPHEHRITKTIGAVFLALGVKSPQLIAIVLSLWVVICRLVNLAADIPDGICLLCKLLPQ